MKLTKDQVKHVAKLANLPLTEGEEEKYSEQLSKILDYIDQLNQVDTENIEPTYNVSGQTNILAPDEVSESLSEEDATKNGTQKDGYFVTKGVFSDE
jgi:aspartyl-tRNA(Asn)/glutamyl-tRNA(Gln) amidotransferase subunit C